MKRFVFPIILLSLICAKCPDDNRDACISAEKNLKKIGCISESKPFTKKGKSFQDFCVEMLDKKVEIHPECLEKITSCEDMDVCTNSK